MMEVMRINGKMQITLNVALMGNAILNNYFVPSTKM